MLNKSEFISLFTNIINGIEISDEDFNRIIDVLKMQRLVDWNYIKDDNLNQSQNILKIIQENTIKFYEIYLGQ